MTKGTIDYEITDVDVWEKDAILKIGGQEFYFQLGDNDSASITDALDYIKNKLERLNRADNKGGMVGLD